MPPGKHTKTGKAMAALAQLLSEIAQDNLVTDDEIKRLYQWRGAYRTVLNRAELKPFAEWFERCIADGEFDAAEREQILQWAQGMQPEVEDEEPVLPPPAPPRERARTSRDWRTDAVTERQQFFLEELGMPMRESRHLTKGEASACIDRLLMERDHQRAMQTSDLAADRFEERALRASDRAADRMEQRVSRAQPAAPRRPAYIEEEARPTSGAAIVVYAVIVVAIVLAAIVMLAT